MITDQHTHSHGPTNFAPVVRQCAQRVQNAQPGTKYSILLILTDGEITDMDDTRRAIIDASHLPVSIIIVGVQPLLPPAPHPFLFVGLTGVCCFAACVQGWARLTLAR